MLRIRASPNEMFSLKSALRIGIYHAECRGRFYIVIIHRGMLGTQRRGGCDFRFFEKKLGKKLPCRVVALKAILGFIIVIKGYNPARKLLLRSVAKFFSKSDNASPRVPCISR